jgi:antitoxin (DNA-binding transcriptional repressor) of toxin-antitoxin stability system
MKTATVADLRNNFAAVSRWIYEGESVLIKKRGKTFAILAPAQEVKAAPAWPLFEERLHRLFPDGPVAGTSSEEIVHTMRGDY